MRQELSRLSAKVRAGPQGPEPKHPPKLRAIPSERRGFRGALRAPASKATARSAPDPPACFEVSRANEKPGGQARKRGRASSETLWPSARRPVSVFARLLPLALASGVPVSARNGPLAGARVNCNGMKGISWRAPADNPLHSVARGRQPWRPAEDGERSQPDRLDADFGVALPGASPGNL